jgi:hypothetical protein
MKYFTPELYVQGNLENADQVDQAEMAWEQAIQRYREHCRTIEPHFPDALRKFHQELCLHDADVFGPAYLPLGSLPGNARAVVIVAQQVNTLLPEFHNTLAILQYGIVAEPVVEVPVQSGIFQTSHATWLYDELDLIEPGVFSHEILLSDGRVVKLRFRDFQYQIAPLISPTGVGPKESRIERALRHDEQIILE